MKRCIHCATEKHNSAFNREHVLNRAFGTFENNLVIDCKCEDCNQFYGDTDRGTRMNKIDRSTYLLLVGALAGAPACSGSEPTRTGSGDSGADGPAAASPACGPANPTGACGDGVCIQDAAGNVGCAPTCTDGSQCPSGASCCGPVVETRTGPRDLWACLPSTFYATPVCRCTSDSTCGTGVCGPKTDATGSPVGPNVCR